MEIVLYSNDPELHGVCREIVHLTPGARVTVKQDFSAPPDSRGICIYDIAAGQLHNLPALDEIRNSILVVNRSDLPLVHGTPLHYHSVVLIKPLNRARLESAIEQSAIEQSAGPAGDMPSSSLMRLNRDQLLECLLHANLKLQEYDRDRTHFLARAIYELRTPLTSLNGYCGLLLDQKLGPLSTEQTNALMRMQRSVTRLARITSTIFELSAGNTPDNVPDYHPGNIAACIEQAVHEAASIIRDRRIDLDADLSAPVGVLSFDPQQMEQAFLNLLENSCKFAKRGGLVHIRGYPYFWERRSLASRMPYTADRRRQRDDGCAPNAYRIDIEDNGPGIPARQLETIFAEDSACGGGSDRSGMGLGLAIARMIVQHHKGRIWAESRGVEGATFCVVLQHANEDSREFRSEYTG